jgi:hypothetical protein
MSRLTGTDALGLFEAYQAVYTPQELSEEQVWEEVEAWVNSLIEEGYDLSDYTWEEMYESYVDEARAPGVKPYRPGPSQAEVRADATAARQKHLESGKDKPGYNPDEKKFTDWKLRATPNTVSTRRTGETQTVSQRMDAEKPYGKRMTGPLAREYGSRTAAEVTRTVRGPGEPQAVTMPRQRGNVSREVIRRKPQAESYDVYDLVLSHLLDEGYADTFEEAEAIMVNMSEEWRGSIISEMINDIPPKSPGKPGEKKSIPGSQEINKAKDPKKYMKKNALY